jgi:Skp family chaperone for outer membrane proteins
MKRLFLLLTLVALLFAASPMRTKRNAQATKAGFSLTQKAFNKSPHKMTVKATRPAIRPSKAQLQVQKKRIKRVLPDHPKTLPQPTDRQIR